MTPPLQKKLSVMRYLSRAGAEIRELNTVRKRLSAGKGGGLPAAAEPARTVDLILVCCS